MKNEFLLNQAKNQHKEPIEALTKTIICVEQRIIRTISHKLIANWKSRHFKNPIETIKTIRIDKLKKTIILIEIRRILKYCEQNDREFRAVEAPREMTVSKLINADQKVELYYGKRCQLEHQGATDSTPDEVILMEKLNNLQKSYDNARKIIMLIKQMRYLMAIPEYEIIDSMKTNQLDNIILLNDHINAIIRDATKFEPDEDKSIIIKALTTMNMNKLKQLLKLIMRRKKRIELLKKWRTDSTNP